MVRKRGAGRRGDRRGNPGSDAGREEFEFPGGMAVRDGKNIYLQTDSDADEHEARLRAVIDAVPALTQERSALLDRLEEVLREAGPLECLALASTVYLVKDAETYRESEDDRSPAHIEFLALSVLPLLQAGDGPAGAGKDAAGRASDGAVAGEAGEPPVENWGFQDERVPEGDRVEGTVGATGDDETSPRPNADEQRLQVAVNDALSLVRNAFRQTTDLFYMQSIANSRKPGADEGFEEFRREALLQSLNIRGSAYTEHVEMVLRGCLDPVDEDCRTHLGFTAGQAWVCAEAVHALLADRITQRMRGMFEEYDRAVKVLTRMRKKKKLPLEVAALSPTRQKAWLRWQIQTTKLADAAELVTFTAADLAAEAGVDERVAEAWLKAFTCDPDLYVARFHRAPCGAHPITQFPVLAVPGGFMVPAPAHLGEALRPVMEDALQAAGKGTWARYDKARALWVEETAASRIAGVLPGSVKWRGVGWASPDDSSDLDGLVSCDDFSARIQCKAGRVSASARRGAPSSMPEDIRAVINDGAHQHARLAAALEGHDASALGFTADQAQALAARLSVEVVVCLDDVTVWSTETHKLRRLVALPDKPQVPWVLSLCDLFAITDLLQGVEFVHYLTRRLRLEAEQKVEAHDELDWVGHYISEGLFFDHFFDGPHPPDAFRLTSFTEFIDTWYFARAGLLRREVPKPAQDMPPALRGLIGRLETDRPRHWLTAGLMLLNGDQEGREQIVQLMEHTNRRAAVAGRCSGTQVYPQYSLTLSADGLCSGPALRDMMRAYWAEKIAGHGRPNAVSLGVGADNKLAVDVVEKDSAVSLAHVLLARDAVSGSVVTAEDPLG